jgi:hypothetical protein
VIDLDHVKRLTCGNTPRQRACSLLGAPPTHSFAEKEIVFVLRNSFANRLEARPPFSDVVAPDVNAALNSLDLNRISRSGCNVDLTIHDSLNIRI